MLGCSMDDAPSTLDCKVELARTGNLILCDTLLVSTRQHQSSFVLFNSKP